MKKLYLLYKFQWGDWGEGGTRVLVAICHSDNLFHAIWQFKLMEFKDCENEINYNIEELSSFDNDGFMFKMPDYLIPD